MSKYAVTTATGAALLLTACAEVPDVTYTYYLAKSQTIASVTATVTCNDKKTPILSYSTPVVSTTYIADYTRPETISLHDLNSNFADNSFTLNLTPDGRLKSVNATWTGQGQTIAQSAITLGATVLALGGTAPTGLLAKGAAKKRPMGACDFIAQKGADGKTLTFVYSNILAPADLGTAPAVQDFDLPLSSGSNMADLRSYLADPTKVTPTVPLAKKALLHVSATETASSAVTPNDGTKYPAHVAVQKLMRVPYQIRVGTAPIYAAAAIVPKTCDDDAFKAGGCTFDVPVTGAKPFGTETFVLNLSDDGSGGIATSTYGDNAGTSASNVITTINSGISAAKPAPTTPPAAP